MQGGRKPPTQLRIKYTPFKSRKTTQRPLCKDEQDNIFPDEVALIIRLCTPKPYKPEAPNMKSQTLKKEMRKIPVSEPLATPRAQNPWQKGA